MENQAAVKRNQAAENQAVRSAKPTPNQSEPIHLFRDLQERLGNRALGRHIQAKLKVSEPHDAYEQEADRVADQVMRMPDPTTSQETKGLSRQTVPQIQRMCTNCEEEGPARPTELPQIQRKCGPCADEEIHRMAAEEEDEESIQRKTAHGDANEVDTDVEGGLSNLSGGGETLSQSARDFFEPRFAHDFAAVRVHRDARAAESARLLDARAYTIGRDIVFGADQYAPETSAGQSLLAHELTHVVQQGKGASRKMIQRQLVYANGYAWPYKTEADEMADKPKWSPSSRDFRATAAGSGGGQAAATFSQLLNIIERQPERSITSLGLIGHANTDNFGLSGEMKPDVTFTEDGLINADTLMSRLLDIMPLRNRFAKFPNSKIILYGCDSGTGSNLMLAISEAFHTVVEGFAREIRFCFIDNGHDIITSRGRTMLDPGLNRALFSCGDFHEDVRNLDPEMEAYVNPEPDEL